MGHSATAALDKVPERSESRAKPSRRAAVVLVVEDGMRLSPSVRMICDFLCVQVERVDGKGDLGMALSALRPMAVVTALDSPVHDGCYVMMEVAEYDRNLPVLLLTGEDPLPIGAADAVEELWRLSEVVKHTAMPSVGQLVDFLFMCGRKGRCMSLMPS